MLLLQPPQGCRLEGGSLLLFVGPPHFIRDNHLIELLPRGRSGGTRPSPPSTPSPTNSRASRRSASWLLPSPRPGTGTMSGPPLMPSVIRSVVYIPSLISSSPLPRPVSSPRPSPSSLTSGSVPRDPRRAAQPLHRPPQAAARLPRALQSVP